MWTINGVQLGPVGNFIATGILLFLLAAGISNVLGMLYSIYDRLTDG